MKKLTLGGLILFSTASLAPQMANAQGTLYFSSLSQSSTGNVSIGSDSWVAEDFGTGNNAGGYLLNSIQLAMTDSSGDPNGFTVMIYSLANNPGAGLPGSSLGTLTGSANPSAAGVYTYTASSTLSLSPSTVYFLVLTSTTPVANGAFNWSESGYPPALNWAGVGNGLIESSNGSSGWSSTPYLGIGQFAITATAAPEPGVLGLLALGGTLIALKRWNEKKRS